MSMCVRCSNGGVVEHKVDLDELAVPLERMRSQWERLARVGPGGINRESVLKLGKRGSGSSGR